MKVRLLKTGEILEANDSYGARLIEQGKARIYVEPPVAPKPEKVKAEPKKLEPKKEELKKEEPEAKKNKSRKGE